MKGEIYNFILFSDIGTGTVASKSYFIDWNRLPESRYKLRYPSTYRSRFHNFENSKKIQTKMRSRSAFQKRKRCDFGFTGAAKHLQIQDILKCLH